MDRLTYLQLLIALADRILEEQERTGRINERAAMVVAFLIGVELRRE